MRRGNFFSVGDWVVTTRRTVGTLLALALLAPGLDAQDRRRGAEDAYFRAVGDFFKVSSSELSILRDWSLPPDEIPVVLFVAARAGVSPEALVALRRSGRGWPDLIGRYRVGPGVLYVPIPDAEPVGYLATAYEGFRGLPTSRWGEIRLSDADIVALVNVRLLSETLRIRPSQVLGRAAPGRSFVDVYAELIR